MGNKKDKTTMKFQNLLLVLILLISYSLTSKVQESCEETFLSEEEAQERSEEEFQSKEEAENGDSMNDQKLEVIKKRFPGFEPQQLLTIMKLIELNHRNKRLLGTNLNSLESLLRKR